jgi:hypothetical protein
MSHYVCGIISAGLRFTKSDPAGEVMSAAASMLTHQVFNSLQNMNR